MLTAWFVFVTFFNLPGFVEDDRTSEFGVVFATQETCDRYVRIQNARSAGMEFFCVEMPLEEK